MAQHNLFEDWLSRNGYVQREVDDRTIWGRQGEEQFQRLSGGLSNLRDQYSDEREAWISANYPNYIPVEEGIERLPLPPGLADQIRAATISSPYGEIAPESLYNQILPYRPIQKDNDLFTYGPFLLAAGGLAALAAPAAAGAGSAAGLGEAVGANAYFAGAGAAGAGATGFAAADLAGLAQMGQAAGLSGAGLEAFIQSGGTLGSTAAGGGGVGFGALSSLAGAPVVEAGGPASAADIARVAGQGAGGAGGAGTALSRIINGTATTADWLSVLGTGGATALGMFSANQQARTLGDIAERSRADRAPFLARANEWLVNPEAYGTGPGQAAMKSTLAGLSARYGNPIGSGTALSIATDAGLRDWRNAVTGMANLGLAGEDIRAQLETGAARSKGDIWSNLAGGVSQLINPRQSLADLLREYRLVVGA